MRKMFTVLFVILSSCTQAQEVGYRTTDAGAEIQWYPAGGIMAIHLAFNAKLHHSFYTRLGYNMANRKNFGKHDDEQGGGFGATFGYRYYIKYKPVGFFLGGRTDLWALNIDWKQGTESGTSKVTVFQPTAELGYTFLINDQVFITPTFTNGFEINIKTRGEPVGEGFITLLGLSAGIRF